MRIIHTSDWHLGQYFYGKSRAAEHQQFLNWLLRQAVDHQVAGIIVAGDVFDTGSPPSYAREMYFDFVVNLHKTQCQLVVLAGNHDSVAMLGESKQLLASLSTRVIPAVTDNIDEQVFTLKDKNTNQALVICAVPFIRPRDVIKSQTGQSAGQKQQSLQQGIKQHYDVLFEHARSLAQHLTHNKDGSEDKAQASELAAQPVAQLARDTNKVLPILATGHLTTVGVTSSDSVRDIYIGTLEAFPANAFPKADYIALGHIHRAQVVAKSQHIRYCGSPIPLSFDEARQDKQVQLVEFEADTFKSVTPLVVPRFQAMAMVKTRLDSLKTDISEAVSRCLTEQQAQQDSDETDVQGADNSSDNSSGNSAHASAKVWLDIEIDSAEYLQDLQTRIESIIADLPVEILLVRRSKKSRQIMPNDQEKITLNELSLTEVFDARLAQEEWPGDDNLQQKQRITDLFAQAVEDVKAKQT